jgi:mono/diheme cytochrome c family protein
MAVLGGVAAAVAGAGTSAVLAADPPVSYRLDVQPILASRCVECHQPGGAGLEKSGFDLTSYEGLMTGTKFGPMVIPGDPRSSNLIRLIEGKAAPELRMPHNQRPLLSAQIDILEDWVKQGARDN